MNTRSNNGTRTAPQDPRQTSQNETDEINPKIPENNPSDKPRPQPDPGKQPIA